MKPSWLKVKLSQPSEYRFIKNRLYGLNTICEEANCPNIHECWKRKTATFLILGDICTRKCLYCSVKNGKPEKPDFNEPKKISNSVRGLKLKYTTITSVTRDDLPDYGVSQFIKTIEEVKKHSKVEVLIPDLKGNLNLLKRIINSKPDVIGHNIEVVENFFSKIRPEGNYKRSINLLKKIKKIDKKQISKSGFMVGFGESKKDIIKTLYDLKEANADIVTIGQYLQPTKKHYPVKKYYHPDEFKDFENIGSRLGFKFVFSGPLVRSSYLADKIIQKL